MRKTVCRKWSRTPLPLWVGLIIAVIWLTSSPLTGHSLSPPSPPDKDIYINNRGQVIWVEHPNIFFFDGKTTTNLTKSLIWSHTPKINNKGQAVWVGQAENSFEIFFFNGTHTIQITNNSFWDTRPQINDRGQVVWQQRAGKEKKFEIFLFDSSDSTITNISNTPDFSDVGPEINNKGHIVWTRRVNDSFHQAIYLYDGSKITQITKITEFSLSPKISNSGQVIWTALGDSSALISYNLTRKQAIPLNDEFPESLQINNSGQAVWLETDYKKAEIIPSEEWEEEIMQALKENPPAHFSPAVIDNGKTVGYRRWDKEVYFYNGIKIKQITNNTFNDHSPAINDNGQVVWTGWDGTDWEIYFFDGTSISQLTDNSHLDHSPQINNSGKVVWFGHDDSGQRVMLYDGKKTFLLPQPSP